MNFRRLALRRVDRECCRRGWRCPECIAQRRRAEIAIVLRTNSISPWRKILKNDMPGRVRPAGDLRNWRFSRGALGS